MDAKSAVPMMNVVAELMIHANAVVGEYLASTWPRAALLRSHAAPRGDSTAGLAVSQLCGKVGVEVRWGSGKELGDSLGEASRKLRDPASGMLLKGLTTLAMSEAEYCSTGMWIRTIYVACVW